MMDIREVFKVTKQGYSMTIVERITTLKDRSTIDEDIRDRQEVLLASSYKFEEVRFIKIVH